MYVVLTNPRTAEDMEVLCLLDKDKPFRSFIPIPQALNALKGPTIFNGCTYMPLNLQEHDALIFFNTISTAIHLSAGSLRVPQLRETL